ncbi:MAG: efflux RND transporter periplasmic adaptor subunit [Acidobacteria bacterium]|nr:MAG: efflux RND transporter periplasmic adaptor subunit [Acidobacteriota bacterium]
MNKTNLLRLLPLVLFPLTGCQTTESAGPAAPREKSVVVGRENTTKAAVQEILTGPLISGTLKAEKEATVRAEVGGAVLQVAGEEGRPVRKGALLARIDAGALNDDVLSAESAVRSAQNAVEVAVREEQRTGRLVEAGALAERNLETAHSAVAGAQAQLADARARLVAARERLAKATVYAPLNGVIAQRPVNAGDNVTSGTVLFVIMDPSRLELQASVPAQELPHLKIGTMVDFEIRGASREHFTGRIDRISPVADPLTRQVSIFVQVPNPGRRLVGGLFAEGRVATQRRRSLVVPVDAVEMTDANPWVLRVRDGRTERVEVRVGVEDKRTERVEIVSGVKEGEVLLVGAAQHITPGTPVTVEGAAGPTPEDQAEVAEGAARAE